MVPVFSTRMVQRPGADGAALGLSLVTVMPGTTVPMSLPHAQRYLNINFTNANFTGAYVASGDFTGSTFDGIVTTEMRKGGPVVGWP